MGAFYRTDTAQSTGAEARILIAAYSFPHPRDIDDILVMTGSTYKYDPQFSTYGWVDLGATDQPAQMRQGYAQNVWRSEQTGPYRTQPGDWTSEIQTEFIEITQQHKVNIMLGIAGTDGAIASKTYFSARTAIPFIHVALCWFDELVGLAHAWYYPKVQWAGSQIQQELARGNPLKIPITWSCYADDTLPDPDVGKATFRLDFDELPTP